MGCIVGVSYFLIMRVILIEVKLCDRGLSLPSDSWQFLLNAISEEGKTSSASFGWYLS
jgi:hypothetical protein